MYYRGYLKQVESFACPTLYALTTRKLKLVSWNIGGPPHIFECDAHNGIGINVGWYSGVLDRYEKLRKIPKPSIAILLGCSKEDVSAAPDPPALYSHIVSYRKLTKREVGGGNVTPAHRHTNWLSATPTVMNKRYPGWTYLNT